MSKVSVTGSKSVMDEVIETLHELHALHLTDYDGSWGSFDNGSPQEGADTFSERLVTVRGLESTLGVDRDEVTPPSSFDPEELDERLAAVRADVNELDDRRQGLRQERREVEDRIAAMEPLARLDIDLDLLRGYDAIEVVVGEGDEESITAAYDAADEVRAVETFTGDGVVAAAVAPAEGVDAEDAATDPLVGIEFSRIEVPDESGSPADILDDLRHRATQLEGELETLEAELEDLELEVAGFLVAAEEYLSIQVQKREAPLRFATTDNSFVAEGWIPATELDTVESALREAVGDRVEFEELERAEYDRHGDVARHEEVDGADEESAAGAAGAGATEGSEEVAADGGVVTVPDDPPVIQDNPGPVGPFETLVRAVNVPKYSELDPTIVLFLTFPLFFGFMIGDVGYGLVYVLLGYLTMRKFDSDAIRQLGVVVVWAGALTITFGILYGEIFGLHVLGEVLWHDLIGMDHPPLRKGLSYTAWARGWLVVAVVVGWIHLTVGWTFDFVDKYDIHGFREALLESGSWLSLSTGIWLWVFSTHLESSKPELLYVTFDGEPFALGFGGFPPIVGQLGLGLIVAGIALLLIGPAYELPEAPQPFVHALSYTRLTAVLLSKAGMALVANMLFFGAYQDEDEVYHYLIDHSPEYVESGHAGAGAELVFGGLMHGGIVSQIAGVVILVIGHVVVLAIGVSAAIQAIRLEYVEFFGKFYEGGGKRFDPFGQERQYTTEK